MTKNVTVGQCQTEGQADAGKGGWSRKLEKTTSSSWCRHLEPRMAKEQNRAELTYSFWPIHITPSSSWPACDTSSWACHEEAADLSRTSEESHKLV